ncbi:H/ACA ribonucleoprotein complex non-core subunit NAF1 [Orchesella cincta]|uniref:H/ACA ribonucleoprotein complex non-core subunit NAF1 n=1 Tax=Orchesella cincta TaxID=48709 RepID=A0A1D2N6Q3_ORCCI|nr:H/ACA ribonucleoprotein complex non-core subunit NAF1 [Orchesella cincta]
MEEEAPVKIKTEPGTTGVGGSLGALVSLYGDDNDDSDQEHEKMEQQGGTELLPNPMFGTVTVKMEPIDKTEDEKPANASNEDNNEITLIAEKKVENVSAPIIDISSDNSLLDRNDANKTSMDFASIRANRTNTEKCQLNVQDFLGDADSYSEARAIKVEVESGTSDSEPDSDPSANESDYEEGVAGGEKDGDGKKKPEVPRAKGELDLKDLPLIEDLHISVPHEDCKPIGLIKSVVEPLVVVEAYPNTPALDLDSVLFLDEGDRALGHIFDVIGPVKQPLYCVRFNSKEHIQKNKVEIGMLVYCAPKTEYTSFVFLAQLRKLKGSDASWVNDIEPPADEVEFSDDEMERNARKKKRNRRNMRARATEADAMYRDDDSTGESQNRGPKRHLNPNGQQTPGNRYGAHAHPPFTPPLVPGFTPYGPMNPGFHPPGPTFPSSNMHHHGGGNPRFRGNRPYRGRHHPVAHPPPQQQYFGSNMHPPASPYSAQNPPHFRPWCPPNPWQNNHQAMNFDFRSQNPFPNVYGQPPPPPPPPPRYPQTTHTNYEPPPPGTNGSK